MKKMMQALALLSVLAMMLSVFVGCGGKQFGYQLENPEAGEEIAVMHTSMGDIYIRLFPKSAPKAVENFKTHAQNGYYDGLTFHRVIDNFMIQGGDPEGTGSGGESIWGEDFEDEFDPALGNLRGSLAMANSGANTNGSQFFINQADAEPLGITHTRELWDKHHENMPSYKSFAEFYVAQNSNFSFDPAAMTDEILATYEEVGGNMYLDGPLRSDDTGHTVFGQVFGGMDVVDAIAAVETDADDKPLEPVTIISIELTTYQG